MFFLVSCSPVCARDCKIISARLYTGSPSEDVFPLGNQSVKRNFEKRFEKAIGGFHLTSSLPCWCTEKKRKKYFGNSTLLLCKTWAIIRYCCFVHQHGILITWFKTIYNLKTWQASYPKQLLQHWSLTRLQLFKRWIALSTG